MRLAVLATAATGFVGLMVVASTGFAAIVAGVLVGWSIAQRGLNWMWPA